MGFKISTEFPSRFVSGDEVENHSVSMKITDVKQEEVPSNPKDPNSEQEKALVVYFDKKDPRGIVLNKTRANEIKRLHGDDTDMWKGKLVTVYTKKQKAFGEIYNVIHFRGEKSVNDETIELDEIPFGN